MRTRTPVLATSVIMVAIGLLAVLFPLAMLARATSGIILVIFVLINLSLWRIKRVDPDLQGRGPRLPTWLPLVSACTCAAVLLIQGWTLLEGSG